MDHIQAFVGLDVHKDTIAVAVADGQPGGEVRFWGTIENSPERLRSLAEKLSGRYRKVEFTYEAGPCGYEIYRGLSARGLACRVVAPSLIPRRPGDRVKNDHRDSMSLARLARGGELTAVWVPDPVHEAMRDLVRARHAANRDLRLARQRIQSFLLRHALTYPKKAWTGRHRTWLADRSFPHAAQQVALQSYLNAMDQACSRREQLEGQIRELVPGWSLAAFVGALQALRGVGLVVAVSVAAEVGEMTRFENPKQLMSFLGLAPGEHSSGRKTRPRGITKAGNVAVRCLLYEAAWSYRYTPKVVTGRFKTSHSWALQNQPRLLGVLVHISTLSGPTFCSKGEERNGVLLPTARVSARPPTWPGSRPLRRCPVLTRTGSEILLWCAPGAGGRFGWF